MAKTYATLDAEYEALSEEFTELNKEVNRAIRSDALTDELEFKFMKAEKALHAAYEARQTAKIEEQG